MLADKELPFHLIAGELKKVLIRSVLIFHRQNHDHLILHQNRYNQND